MVVFSNQRGISDNPTKLYAITGKITDMMQVLGMSFQVFIATATDVYRKPAIGMWEFMCQNCNDGIAPRTVHARAHLVRWFVKHAGRSAHKFREAAELSRCVYVGDFGGRVENWRPGKKADKEATDRYERNDTTRKWGHTQRGTDSFDRWLVGWLGALQQVCTQHWHRVPNARAVLSRRHDRGTVLVALAESGQRAEQRHGVEQHSEWRIGRER